MTGLVNHPDPYPAPRSTRCPRCRRDRTTGRLRMQRAIAPGRAWRAPGGTAEPGPRNRRLGRGRGQVGRVDLGAARSLSARTSSDLAEADRGPPCGGRACELAELTLLTRNPAGAAADMVCRRPGSRPLLYGVRLSVEGSVVGLFVLDRWDVSQGSSGACRLLYQSTQPAVAYSTSAMVCRGRRGRGGADALGLVEAVDRLHQGVVVGVADGADRGGDAGLERGARCSAIDVYWASSTGRCNTGLLKRA